jgi:predicted lactoylglutathione lyase
MRMQSIKEVGDEKQYSNYINNNISRRNEYKDVLISIHLENR